MRSSGEPGETVVGRFTGWQIVTMVVALAVVVVAFPVGVLAATGQLVNITDPVTASHKARVNAEGGLAVTPRDPTNGYQARVSSNGRLRTDVRGYVTAPSTAFSVVTTGDHTLQSLVPSFTSGKMMITSITYSPLSFTGTAFIYKYSDGTCSSNVGYFFYMRVPIDTTTSAAFPTPIVVKQRCAHLGETGGGPVTITGYLVP